MKTLIAASVALIFSQAVVAQTLQNGLIAHYEFEGNAKDSSLNGNDGVERNAVRYKEGVFGYAAEFDGISSYIEVPHNDNQNLKTMTFSAWVYDYSHEKASSIFVKGVMASPTGPVQPTQTRQYGIQSYPKNFVGGGGAGDVLGGCIFNSGAGKFWECGFSDPPTAINEWIHLVLSYDGNKIKVYVNGVLKKERTVTFVPFVPPIPEPIIIGGAAYDAVKRIENVRTGLIDDLRIYNRALTACEIKKLYDTVSYPDNRFKDKICDNQPPIAEFNVTRPDPNLRKIQLDASASQDIDGQIIKYEWLILPDGLTFTGKKPTLTLPEGGIYEIILTVTDDKGAKHSKRLNYTLDDSDCQGRSKYDVSQQTLYAPYVRVLDQSNTVVWIGEALFHQAPDSELLFNLTHIKELNPPPLPSDKDCPATYKLNTQIMRLPFIDVYQADFPSLTYSGTLKDLSKKDGKDLFVIQSLLRKQ